MAQFCHPEFGCDCSEEIARLREALQRIADMVPNAGSLDDQPVGIARAALEVS